MKSKLMKRLVALFTVMAMMAMGAMTAMASEPTVTIYGYYGGAYVETDHAQLFMDSVELDGGEYILTFSPKEYGNYGVQYLTEMTINGEYFEADEETGIMEVAFVYTPEALAGGVTANTMTFNVSITGHPTLAGAISIN